MRCLFTSEPRRPQPLLSNLLRTTREPHPYATDEKPFSPCQRRLGWLVLLPLLPLLFVIVLLRIVCFLALMIFLLVPCGLATYGAPPGPLRGWRRWLAKTGAAVVGRAVLACFGCGWGMLKVRGGWDPTCPVIVCAPHVGMTDGYVWMMLDLPRPVILEPYTKIPVVATLLKAASALPVPVASAGSKAANGAGKVGPSAAPAPEGASAPATNGAPPPTEPLKASATAAVRAKILEHKRTFTPGVDDAPIALFPEGITHNGRTLLSFFAGAFEGGSAVQPVVLRYTYTHFNAHAFLSSLPTHLMRLFINPWLYIEVDFLEALQPTEAQKADGRLLAQAARAAMASASGMPLHELGAKELREEMKKEAAAKAAAKQAANKDGQARTDLL